MKLWLGKVKEIKMSGGKKAIQFDEHQFDPGEFARVFKEARGANLGILKAAEVAMRCAHSVISWHQIR